MSQRLDFGAESMELAILWERNQKIARVMELNPSVLSLATRVIEQLKGWAERNHISIEDIVINEAMIPRGVTYIVAKLQKKSDFEYEQEHKLEKGAS